LGIRAPPDGRQQLAERRQKTRSADRRRGPPDLAPQHLQLMPQHQGLKLLRPLRATKRNQQLEQTANQPVSERQSLKQQTSSTHPPTLPPLRRLSLRLHRPAARQKPRNEFVGPTGRRDGGVEPAGPVRAGGSHPDPATTAPAYLPPGFRTIVLQVIANQKHDGLRAPRRRDKCDGGTNVASRRVGCGTIPRRFT
jgi:hypothetical protein